MIWTIVVILIVLWLLGLAANVAGGVIHLLLVLALIVIAVNFIQGRRTV
ncbi:MAG TPA: lmo0937 family membrane protein [Anaerolineae bacterium]|nr:lmo0937 family membrane protein [Anaerolineae bacterium]